MLWSASGKCLKKRLKLLIILIVKKPKFVCCCCCCCLCCVLLLLRLLCCCQLLLVVVFFWGGRWERLDRGLRYIQPAEENSKILLIFVFQLTENIQHLAKALLNSETVKLIFFPQKPKFMPPNFSSIQSKPSRKVALTIHLNQ